MPSNMTVGAGWRRESHNGDEFISITIDAPCSIVLQPGQSLCLFVNDRRNSDREPDYRLIVMADRRPAGEPRNGQRTGQRGAPTHGDDLDEYQDDFQAPPPRTAQPRQQAPAAAPPRQASRQQAPAADLPPMRPGPRQPPRRPEPVDDQMDDITDPFAE